MLKAARWRRLVARNALNPGRLISPAAIANER